MNFKIVPLSEEQIQKLPFPETARKLGGLLVMDEAPLENHLNVEEFRRLWNEQILSNEFRISLSGTEEN